MLISCYRMYSHYIQLRYLLFPIFTSRRSRFLNISMCNQRLTYISDGAFCKNSQQLFAKKFHHGCFTGSCNLPFTYIIHDSYTAANVSREAMWKKQGWGRMREGAGVWRPWKRGGHGNVGATSLNGHATLLRKVG